jgi:type II secretory pathway pseudopilin PulG
MKVIAQTSPASARRGVRRSTRAVTLLEVMIATMVLALTITSSLLVLKSGFQMIETARYTTLAGQILQSQMEKLRLLSYTQLQGCEDSNNTPHGPSTFTPDLVQTVAGTLNQLNRFTSCTQSITPGSTTNVINILLTATWTGSDGMSHTRTYYTQYAQYGISDLFYS